MATRPLAETHDHSFYEFTRFFPLGDLAYDVDWLSPDGGHDPGVEEGALLPSSHKSLRGKVAEPKPYIAIQCRNPECRHVEHVELHKAEWDKIVAAYEKGALDPEGNGAHRLLSQMSLDELGLGRVAEMLAKKERALSGAVEDLDAEREFVPADESPAAARARETQLRGMGLKPEQAE